MYSNCSTMLKKQICRFKLRMNVYIDFRHEIINCCFDNQNFLVDSDDCIKYTRISYAYSSMHHIIKIIQALKNEDIRVWLQKNNTKAPSHCIRHDIVTQFKKLRA
jgi:hypothetical protein